MKLHTTLLAAVASVGLISAAHAVPVTGQVSLGGFVEAIGSVGVGSATGLDFVQNGAGSASPGVAGGLTSVGAGTGSFAGLNCGSSAGTCGSIKDILSFTTSAPISSFLTFTAGQTGALSFDLSSITGVVRNAGGANANSLTITANGTINYTGFDSTAGTFILTAQGDNIVSFSATTLTAANPVPEPASLAILGGSLAALGLIRRKKA